tara:strand:+ start:9976 stop:10128 length:153 start_codon:yes stop_codon:yes gene_type:complete
MSSGIIIIMLGGAAKLLKGRVSRVARRSKSFFMAVILTADSQAVVGGFAV